MSYGQLRTIARLINMNMLGPSDSKGKVFPATRIKPLLKESYTKPVYSFYQILL
jgi:hypothetical protein